MQRQTVADIDLDALRANVRALADRARPAELMPAVKADAYGHGAVLVARALEAEGVRRLAVMTLDEGLELRAAGIDRAAILVMGVTDPAHVAEAARNRLALAVHGIDHARGCIASARAAGVRLRVHLKVDTGMHRLGAPPEDVPQIARLFADAADAVEFEGLMSHLACDEEADLAFTHEQLRRFAATVDELERLGLRPPIAHVANSAGVLRCRDARFEVVRPGLAVYGLSPCPEVIGHADLRPVMSVRTVVEHIQDIEPDEGVSYGHIWRPKARARVAVLPIGYADGYPRAMSNRGQVRVEGRLASVVGRVCMDMTLVDVTDVPAARVGSRVTVLEADPGSPLSAQALAATAGTIPHEILTGIGRRVPRIAGDRQPSARNG